MEESEWESGRMDWITSGKLLEAMDEFSPTKSSGCLNFNSRTYLMVFRIIPEQLAHLFNLSIKCGQVLRSENVV